ncbi:hypothetical protein HDU87_004849 [Geranomyces variabilis]|uniref:Disease resistance R13L4/SHOC-2-like LRR domain-containing protein n=1 Tax=Geranomyces variabilis TaxID=109894 RepID=A0AAD5TIT3_9FUNG|nr:hypothetical protein HDU87_004849 [Geranomyces variabilis]
MTSRPSDDASSTLPSPSQPIHNDNNPQAPDPLQASSIPRPLPFRVHARTSSLDARSRGPPPLRQAPPVAGATVPLSAPARPRSTELLAPTDRKVDKEPGDMASVMALLEEERAKEATSLNLSDRNLASLPPEVGSLVTLERLGLSNNMLTALPAEIAGLVHLRYLNLRSNQIREFPTVICQLACLEILDISRNRLKKMPASFGNLMNLKVLSLARNKLHQLPQYIGSMAQLTVLKLEHNPLQWPPPDILQNAADVPHETWVQTFREFLLAEGAEAPGSPTRVPHQRFATLDLSAIPASPSLSTAFQTPHTPKPRDDVPVPPLPSPAPSRDCHAQIRNYLRRRQYEIDAGVEPPPAADAAPSRVLEALAYSLSCLHKAASHLLLEIADTDGTDPCLVDVAAHIDGLNSATSALVSLLTQTYQPQTPHTEVTDYFGNTERRRAGAAGSHPHTPGAATSGPSAAAAALAAASHLVRVLRGPADAHFANVDVRTARTLLSDWHLANVELADAAAAFERMLDPPLGEPIIQSQHSLQLHTYNDSHVRTTTTLSSSSSTATLASNIMAPPALCEAAKNAVAASRHVLTLLGADVPAEAEDLLAALRLMQDSGSRLSDVLEYLESAAGSGDVKGTRRVAEESSHLIKAVTKMSAEARTLAKTHPFPRPLMAALHNATRSAKLLAVCIAGIKTQVAGGTMKAKPVQ